MTVLLAATFTTAAQAQNFEKMQWFNEPESYDISGGSLEIDNIMAYGTPEQQVVYHNAMQAIAEDTRLGIPVVISNDRQYNAWGGMIDTAHDAFGAANDLALSEKLWTIKHQLLEEIQK